MRLNDNWKHIKETVLQDYIINSLILILGVSFEVCCWVFQQRLTTVCSFPFKRTIELLLILPMAIPAYIIAYTYTEYSISRDQFSLTSENLWDGTMVITSSKRFVRLVEL